MKGGRRKKKKKKKKKRKEEGKKDGEITRFMDSPGAKRASGAVVGY